MVNTRRMESVGTASDNRSHRTRRRVVVEEEEEEDEDEEEEADSSSVNSDRDEESQDKSTKRLLSTATNKNSKETLPSRVRELRNRFVYTNHRFSSRLRGGELNSHKRVSIDERHHSLTVYSSRNMLHDDSDLYNGNDESDDDIYKRNSSRRSRSSYLRRTSSSSHTLSRIQRRTALSLRPIRQKCYADLDDNAHSPLQYNNNTDSDNNNGVVGGVRRSKRKRKVQFDNMSWLTDDQMHKIGYPNLNNSGTGYSEEEDSRDAQEIEVRRSTRHTTEKRNQKKYLFDYDESNDVVQPSRRRLLRNSTSNNNNNNNNKEKNDLSRIKNILDDNEDGGDNDEDNEKLVKKVEVKEESNENVEIKENGIENEINKSETKQQDTSESSEGIGLRNTRTTQIRTRRTNMLLNQTYSTSSRSKCNDKVSDSSSSETEEEGRKSYSLRNRQPKPVPIKTSALRTHELTRSRRRFTRRRKVSSSSSSSTSDSDIVRHDKTRGGKTPKSQHSKNDQQKMKSGAGGCKIIPIGPETLDTKVRFSSIGGLDGHIQCLKEMILLPMMYPEVFKQFQIQPPRGVLFHGPPGTGKTLIARALANECSFGCRKVSFFMRKGADLLSKWIGESEKQLRLLFEQSAEMHPSIIFFDELDGLAPVRSSRQDQVHASIVSTLLALMDGLDNRGEVIVIGATNRIDAIDPALRRPGRFDRELYFPLPAKKERKDILKVHVSQWKQPPNEQLLEYLAESAVGYCGSDLRALCSEAVIQGFRRWYPQVYNADYKLLLNPENVIVEKIDFLRAKSLLVPASHRITQGLGRKLMPILEPLLSDALKVAFLLIGQSFPHGVNPLLSKVKLSPNMRPAQLLLLGEGPEYGQTQHLAPAILYNMEHIHSYLLDLGTLYRETGRSPEETCLQVFNEARRNVPSVIYIPNIDNWWNLVNETVHAILQIQLSQLDPNIPILFLATADSTYDNLPEEIQNIFSRYRKEVYQLELPNDVNRLQFFKSLLLDNCLKPPRLQRNRPKTPPTSLPRAPTPPPSPLSEEQAKKIFEHEEHTLRELRIFLRDMCKKLANNKLFYMFTKPVDTEEVPDYTTIIKQPMDLETMMTKVDFHRYNCAKDFLKDIELICQNALEYNPARTSADKQIRHRACSLRDYAYTLIKNEMDSDFEDKCQDIATQRLKRKASVNKFLPAYIQTPHNLIEKKLIEEENEVVEKTDNGENNDKDDLVTKTNENDDENLVNKVIDDDKKTNEEKLVVEQQQQQQQNSKVGSGRKRKIPSWQRGYLKKRKKKIVTNNNTNNVVIQEGQEEINNVNVTQEEQEEDETDDSKCGNSLININCNENHTSSAENDESLQNSLTPLTINCNDDSVINPILEEMSPKRRLSDLMSPSELLENHLEFDDVDQALNENAQEKTQSNIPVECNKEELNELLEYAVKVTCGSSLQSLLDLYNQLSMIVKKFSNTHNRINLPKELKMELTRFNDESNKDGLSESN